MKNKRVAKLDELKSHGEVQHPEPHVAVVRDTKTGHVTRWLESLAGHWLCVDDQVVL